MPTAILLLVVAAYLLFISTLMKVTGGGWFGVCLFKLLPAMLSFGVAFVALGKIN